MTQAGNTHHPALARNTVFNVLGQLVPLGVGFVTIPFVVTKLGPERFGILSLAWLLLGYFSLFDLGLGRATTKFLAESLNEESSRAPKIFWTSLFVQLALSLVGTILVCVAVPLLVPAVINVPEYLLHETRLSFFILGASLPAVLGSNAIRGALEAGQRFDIVNCIKVPANVAVFVLPVVALYFDGSLPLIVLLLVIARVLTGGAYLAWSILAFPVLRRWWTFDWSMVRPLLVYGGWLTASNVINPILSYSDRFLISAVLSITWLGYYTVPSEALSRMAVLPASLMVAAFPAFAAISSSGNYVTLIRLYRRMVKWILVAMIPITIILILFANSILSLWLGQEFAAKTTLVFQVLSVTYLINAIDMVPYTFLQAVGHAQIPAKLSFIQAPFYILVLWLMTAWLGVTGAALATMLRISIECAVLLAAAQRISSKMVAQSERFSRTSESTQGKPEISKQVF